MPTDKMAFSYKIPEVSLQDYVECLKPIYRVLEKKNKSVSSPDVFLEAILAAHGGMTVDQLNRAEKQRQYEKALSMKMGDFHEELMGKFPGYETLPVGHVTGTDFRKLDDSEFFEVKNRHNTLNSDSSKSVIRKLTDVANSGKKSVLVLVNCVKNRKIPRFKAPENVHVVNGKAAYTYLSKRETFFDDLRETLSSTFSTYPTFEALESGLLSAPQPERV